MDMALGASASLVPRAMRVVDKVPEFEGTATLRLETGAPGLAFEPGQFVMVSKPGIGDVPISISGSADEPEVLDLTVRAAGATTRAIVSSEPGSWLGIRGPYGTAWPVEAAQERDLILMAGGLGLAPLRAAFLFAYRQRARYRRLILLYGAREPATLLYDEELLQWIGEERAEVHVTVDTAEPGWTGNVGLITRLLDRKEIDPERSTVFVCGPEVMMRLCARHLEARGVPPSDIFVSLERHMACGTAQCGRCQLGPFILCRDGPVVRYDQVARPLSIAEL